jgi:hypothetical protein
MTNVPLFELDQLEICPACGKDKCRTNFRRCDSCALIARDYTNNKNNNRRLNGICISCGIADIEKLRSKHYYVNCLNKRAKSKSDTYHKVKNEVFQKYGGYKCNCCGEETIEFLTVDHINGGGKRHRKEIRIDFYLWLKRNKFPDGFQILCMNCQFGRKKCIECPHKSEYNLDAEYF